MFDDVTEGVDLERTENNGRARRLALSNSGVEFRIDEDEALVFSFGVIHLTAPSLSLAQISWLAPTMRS